MKSLLRVSAAWLVRQRVFLAVLLLLAVLFAPHPPLLNNETDVLPLARQALDPDWLPRDWYLNQRPGYRATFDYTLGWLVTVLPTPAVAVIGRLLAFALFASALQVLARDLRLSAGWTVLGLAGFLGLFAQSLIAGEWMVGGVETKPFAYSFCLLALTALVRRQYEGGLLLLGLAVACHVLVGLYATLCAGAMLLLHRRRLAGSWRRLVLGGGLFVLASAPGWCSAIEHLQGSGGEMARLATRIYVHVRDPWHLLPSYWLAHDGALGWKLLGLVVCVVGLVAVAWHSRDEEHRMVAVFALVSLGLFALGLIWAALDADGLLQYYWFRFPDTMVPFLGCILLADLLGAGLRRLGHGRLPAALVVVLCLAVIGWVAEVRACQAAEVADLGSPFALGPEPARADVQWWVRAHTPRQAVFFVDPFWDEFYLLAERARFVSFKHFPQTAPAAQFLEWYHRLAGPAADPQDHEPTSDPRQEFRQRFKQLSAADIRSLANRYGLTHAIVALANDPFRATADRPAELYRNQRYIVYQLQSAGMACEASE